MLLGACSTAPETHFDCDEHYRFRNAMPCATFKQEHLSASGLDVTFSETPTVTGEHDYWVVTWNGIDVLLPHLRYEDVYLFRGTDGRYNVRLSAGDHFQINLLANQNDRYEDVFAVSTLHDRTIETTAEGIAATRAMFGGAIRYSELMMRAYAATPDHVTCCKDRYDAEMGTVVALIMKRIDGSDGVVAAYAGVGRYNGWMTASRSEGLSAYALNIVPDKDAETILHIAYEMAANAPHHTIPFLVGGGTRPAATAPPDWIETLNRALQEDSDNAWRSYMDAAVKAGLSPKSIQMVEQMLPVPQGK